MVSATTVVDNHTYDVHEHEGHDHTAHIENDAGHAHNVYVHPTYGQTVFGDHLICMEDGLSMKMLKRHLLTVHGMTPDVDFSKPLNQMTAAIPLIIGIADFTWQAGDLTFTGIALGSIAALLPSLGITGVGVAYLGSQTLVALGLLITVLRPLLRTRADTRRA